MLPWVYGLIAVLFNPIVKIHLPKEAWAFVDVGAGVLLLVTAKTVKVDKKGYPDLSVGAGDSVRLPEGIAQRWKRDFKQVVFPAWRCGNRVFSESRIQRFCNKVSIAETK